MAPSREHADNKHQIIHADYKELQKKETQMNSNILFYPLEREKFCTHIPDEDLFIESQSGDSVLKNIFLLLAVLRERIFFKKWLGSLFSLNTSHV